MRQTQVNVRISSAGAVSRRGFAWNLAAGAAGLAAGSWLDLVGLQAKDLRRKGMACILLWMNGGPSQFETFDPKPGTASRGGTRAIPTAAAGVQIAEWWVKTAAVMDRVALIRSMTNREGNHGRATYMLHTGYAPSGSVVHPGLGSIVASELGEDAFDLPNFVSISGASIGPSFLGIQHAPLIVSDPTRPPDNLASAVKPDRFARRMALLQELEEPFARSGAAARVRAHRAIYAKATQVVLSPRVKAFDLNQEPAATRDLYGRTAFGQGCLMARRLVEVGVPFVEVQSNGWDTHAAELASLKKLIPPVDQGYAALLGDLKARALLEKTLVIWMGEFGRTPAVNLNAGRDHFPHAFTVALAGGGIRGGQVVGRTDRTGAEISERPLTVPDLFCTFCHSLGIDPRSENPSNVGRPIPIVEGGKVVRDLFS